MNKELEAQNFQETSSAFQKAAPAEQASLFVVQRQWDEGVCSILLVYAISFVMFTHNFFKWYEIKICVMSASRIAATFFEFLLIFLFQPPTTTMSA